MTSQGLPLDRNHGLPGAEEFDDLGYEQADGALGEGVVIRVADAANGRVYASLGHPPSVFARR